MVQTLFSPTSLPRQACDSQGRAKRPNRRSEHFKGGRARVLSPPCSTRRRHGLPPQPFAFFRNIHREVIEPGWGFIVLAKSASKAVAGAVFFCTATNAVFKFGASEERYWPLRPNNLVMWRAIQELTRRDIAMLHLGRTTRGDEGLRRFKLGWGAVEEPINYFRFDLRSNRWTTTTDKASRTHNAIFSRLPLAINRLIGAAIYPHLD